MKNFLFLDDTDARHERFAEICKDLGVRVWHVRTASQAIRAIEGNRFDCVFLDHDLEDTCTDTGQVVADFIALHVLFDNRPKQVIIHSWNPEGAITMENVLKDNGFLNVKRIPFTFQTNSLTSGLE